jgi:hypothetical protein
VRDFPDLMGSIYFDDVEGVLKEQRTSGSRHMKQGHKTLLPNSPVTDEGIKKSVGLRSREPRIERREFAAKQLNVFDVLNGVVLQATVLSALIISPHTELAKSVTLNSDTHAILVWSFPIGSPALHVHSDPIIRIVPIALVCRSSLERHIVDGVVGAADRGAVRGFGIVLKQTLSKDEELLPIKGHLYQLNIEIHYAVCSIAVPQPPPLIEPSKCFSTTIRRIRPENDSEHAETLGIVTYQPDCSYASHTEDFVEVT